MLHGGLRNERFVRVVEEEACKEITDKVVGLNIIERPKGPIDCYRHGMEEMVYLPLKTKGVKPTHQVNWLSL